ncbi:MAG: hypothetical protein C5B54_07870 [Acidobacteria bacterium]|nr:MAG: hypothetical protein C5B54_07870 [Acidobacteriota bacterium]
MYQTTIPRFCDSLSDQDFLEAFESATIPNGEFKHKDHIRVAYLYLKRDGFKEGTKRIIEGIQNFARSKNLPNLYHQTITLFWIQMVHQSISKRQVEPYEAFLECNPALQRKETIYEFYSPELLKSEEARTKWIKPDLRNYFSVIL